MDSVANKENIYSVLQENALKNQFVELKKKSPSVCGSAINFVTQSTKFVPLKGSPPIPTQVDCPRPTAVVW